MFQRPREVKQHEAHAVKSLLSHPGWKIVERELEYMTTGLTAQILNGQLSHDDYVRYTGGRLGVIDVIAMVKSISKQAKESQGA